MVSWVVIGQSPMVDTSIVVGPYQAGAKALSASDDMEKLGYTTEICETESVADVVARGEVW